MNKITFDKKCFSKVDPILSRVAQEMGESLSRRYDDNMREMLVSGINEKVVNNTLFKLNIKGKILSLIIRKRIELAEWIGGEWLHEHCGDY